MTAARAGNARAGSAPPDRPTEFQTAEAWRRWLERNHARASELVVRLFRVHAREQGLGYAEALDEALCWGWIDGVRRSHDPDSFTIRFTPRKPRSIWSAVNVRHVERLIREGRMRPPGLAAFEARTASRTAVYSFEQRVVELAPEHLKRFKADKAAWRWFERQAPYYRRTATHWVMSAKRDETRIKRLGVLIECCRAGLRIPPLRPSPPKR